MGKKRKKGRGPSSPRRYRKCVTGKVRYKDDLDAKIALASTQRSKSNNRDEVRTYKCPKCRGYHLTSIPEWKEGENARRDS